MRYTWIVLGVLVVALVLMSIYWRAKTPPMDGMLLMQGDRQVIFDQWDTLPMVDIETSHDLSFRGYRLEDFLEACDAGPNWSTIIITADDGARTILKRDNLARPYLALVTDDGERYFRFVLPDAEFQQHWIKYVRRIDLE